VCGGSSNIASSIMLAWQWQWQHSAVAAFSWLKYATAVMTYVYGNVVNDVAIGSATRHGASQ